MTVKLFQTVERETRERERSLLFSPAMFSFFLSCYVSLSFLFLFVFFFSVFLCFSFLFFSLLFLFFPFFFFFIFLAFFFSSYQNVVPPPSLFFTLGPPLVFISGRGRGSPSLSNCVVGGARATLPLSSHGDKVRWLGQPLRSRPRAARRA